jgi:phosphoribosylformimino-5-aminoimidazole carboxamide ribotide isomerase
MASCRRSQRRQGWPNGESGARSSRSRLRRTLKLQVGGGVRSEESIEDLLSHGVERVVVGSAAVEEPQSVIAWLKRFGGERVCLAFDVRLDAFAVPRVRTRGWTKSTPLDLWRAVKPFLAHGLKHVLCTDVERDGTLAGPNLALYAQAAAPYRSWRGRLPAACATPAICQRLRPPGAAAAVRARPYLTGRINLRSYKHSCQAHHCLSRRARRRRRKGCALPRSRGRGRHPGARGSLSRRRRG